MILTTNHATNIYFWLMTSSQNIEQPIIHHLIMITKKYLSSFSDFAHDIPLERYHYALLYIHQNSESLTQKDLANYFQVDKSFMVNMIDYLSTNDFVYRETSTQDRRKHLIKLTDKAKEFIPKINEAIKKTNQLSLKGINNTDQKLFFEIIKQLEINLNIDSEHIINVDYTKSKNPL